MNYREIVGSTEFLTKLREQVPENLREEWDKYIELQIAAHEKMLQKVVNKKKQTKGDKDVSES